MLKDQISGIHLVCLLGPALDEPGDPGDAGSVLQPVGGLNRAAWIPDTAQASSACVQLQRGVIPSPPCSCLNNGRALPLKLVSVFLGPFGGERLVWCHCPGWVELQCDSEQGGCDFGAADKQLCLLCLGHLTLHLVVSSTLGAFQGVCVGGIPRYVCGGPMTGPQSSLADSTAQAWPCLCQVSFP